MDQPFPNKPVIHRRSPRTQASLTQEFEKISLSTQQRDIFSPVDNSNGFQNTAGIQWSKEDMHSLSIEELQMAKAIHAQELMLQGKLRKVGEKIRQKIQSQSADSAANDHQSKEKRELGAQAGRREVKTKAMLSECEPGRSKDKPAEESKHGNFNHKIKTQSQHTKDMTGSHPEEQRVRWEETESLLSKGLKDVHVMNRPKMDQAPSKAKREEINNYGRGKGEDRQEQIISEKRKIHDSRHGEASLNKTGWTKAKSYKERTHTKSYNDHQEMSEKSGKKYDHRQPVENQERAGRKLSEEPTFPLVFSSPQQHVEEPLISMLDDNPQLLPCSFCNRTFRSERLEKHMKICRNLKQSQRQVYNSSFHRTKGSQVEEFFKTHIRSKSPEFPTKKIKKTKTTKLFQDQRQAGGLEPKLYK